MPDGERRVEAMWGTVITVDVRAEVDPRDLDAVFDWFQRIDDLFSTWRPDSEICRLGRGDLDLTAASPEVRTVLAMSDRMRAETWGAFEVRVAADRRVTPWEGSAPIDPSGIIKGWALDRCAELLRSIGVEDFAINAGGDVLVAGHAAGTQGWLVGIQHPRERDKTMCSVTVTDAGVATSGVYERGNHVIDPRSGEPAVALIAATVVARELAVADAYATALVAMGEDSSIWLAEHSDIAALTVSQAGVVTTTRAFDELRSQTLLLDLGPEQQDRAGRVPHNLRRDTSEHYRAQT